MGQTLTRQCGVVRLRPKPKIPRYCKQVDVCRRQWWWIVVGKW